MVDPEDDETERLRRIQADRARIEEELAERSQDEEEQRIHERRSDKADYLREKLDEQQRSG
jgi:hypothetical protein